jgi:hypothetical protein
MPVLVVARTIDELDAELALFDVEVCTNSVP